MKQSQPFSPLEIVTATLLAIILLSSMALTGLTIGSGNSVLPCLAPGIASAVGSLMLFVRDRRKKVSVMAVVASIALVLIGGTWTGLTGFSESIDFFTISLCITPGVLASLLGLGTYWYETRRRVYEDEDEAVGEETAVAPTTTATKAEPTTANGTILAYQAQLARVGVYRERIEALIAEKKDTPFAHQFDALTSEIEHWDERVNELVQRLIAFEENELLKEDFESVPAAIANLEQQLEHETDAPLRAEMEQTLAGYYKHQAQLDSLMALMRRTELDVEEMVAALGTVYSQLQVLDATDIKSERAKRLAHDLEEEVNRLNDLLHAVEDVYDDGRLQ